MEDKITKETYDLLDKISYLVKVNIPSIKKIKIEDLSSEEVTSQINYHFNIFKSMTTKTDIEKTKLAIISNQFKALNINSIDIVQSFLPTIFGQIEEKFRWSFEIEHCDEEDSDLKKYIAKTIEKIREENVFYNEKPGLRYTSVLDQDYKIFSLVKNIKKQLPPIENSNLFLLCSIIVYDFERLSIGRQNNFVSYQSMYSEENPLDQWTSCLTIKAEYKKPKFNKQDKI